MGAQLALVFVLLLAIVFPFPGSHAQYGFGGYGPMVGGFGGYGVGGYGRMFGGPGKEYMMSLFTCCRIVCSISVPVGGPCGMRSACVTPAVCRVSVCQCPAPRYIQVRGAL